MCNFQPPPSGYLKRFGPPFHHCLWCLNCLEQEFLHHNHMSILFIQHSTDFSHFLCSNIHVNDFRVMTISCVICLIILGLVTALGIITSVYYVNCDPLVEKKITKGDQVVYYIYSHLFLRKNPLKLCIHSITLKVRVFPCVSAFSALP